jgi:DNA modification methylase
MDYKSENVWLMQGDCLEKMQDIPDGSIDAIITDPPYGITACKWDSVIPLEPMWEQLRRIIKPNGAIVLFGSQPFTSALVMSNIKMFKYDYTWIKTKASGFQNAKKMPMRKHEEILVFYEKQPTFNQQNLIKLDTPIKSGRVRLRNDEQHRLGVAGKTEHKTTHTGWQNSLLNFSNPSGKGHLHPTQKPVPLMEHLIKTYTNESETVLDFTMGSGSTGVACINTNRNFIGIELDQGYFDIACKRIEDAQHQVRTSSERKE